MKIFGINFTTKKELKQQIAELYEEVDALNAAIDEAEEQFAALLEAFPFTLGQTVYDVALKNDKGRYTKTKPSREHSIITPIVVDEKNYFKLVERFRHNDVFDYDGAAEEYLDSICK